jgi:hypothetical protein
MSISTLCHGQGFGIEQSLIAICLVICYSSQGTLAYSFSLCLGSVHISEKSYSECHYLSWQLSPFLLLLQFF